MSQACPVIRQDVEGAFAGERGVSQLVSAAFYFQFSDRWLSGQKQQTVNLPAHVAYGGSNPPLSTIEFSIFDCRFTIEVLRSQIEADSIANRQSSIDNGTRE